MTLFETKSIHFTTVFLLFLHIPTGQTVIQGNLGSLKLGFLTTLRRNNLYEHSDLNMKYMIQAMKKNSLDGYNLKDN